MLPRKSGAVRAALAGAAAYIVVVLAGIGLAFYARQDGRDTAALQAAQKSFAEYLAAQCKDVLASPSGPGGDLSRWTRSLSADPEIGAAGVFGPRGEKLSISGRTSAHVAALEYRPGLLGGQSLIEAVDVPRGLPEGPRRWQRATVRLAGGRDDSPGQLQILFRWPTDSAAGGPARIVNWLGLLLVASALLGVVYLWVRRALLVPLDAVGEQASRAAEGHPPRWPAEIPCELEPIVLGVDSLFRSMIGEHHRAEQLELTVERRVESRTRTIQAHLHRALNQSTRDPLTRLANRWFVDSELDGLLASVRRANEDLACVYFDVDHFKSVNDTFGHHAGDELLVFVGTLLRGATRTEDVAARLGGDEFCLLMPGADAKAAQTVAERVLALFRQYAQMYRDRLPVLPAISCGIATLKASAPADGAELLRMADAALYRAKHTGRCGVYAAAAG